MPDVLIQRERHFISHTDADKLRQQYAAKFKPSAVVAEGVVGVLSIDYYEVDDDDPRAGTTETVDA